MSLSVSHALTFDMGTIGVGQGGWVNENYAIVELTCTVNANSNWSLNVTASDFNENFDKSNLRFKVFYIGYARGGVPVGVTTELSQGYPSPPSVPNLTYWNPDGSALLDVPFQGEDFVAYTGPGMKIAGHPTLPDEGNKVVIVVAITVTVPEKGVNLVNQYLSSLTFSLTE